jgi:hypothetical protein
MASKGLRAMSYQVTRKVEADYNPSHTSETLIGYTACCAVVHLYFIIVRPFHESAQYQVLISPFLSKNHRILSTFL